MAYKYQSLAATMSGSLTQEGDFTVKDHSGAEKATIGIDGAMSGSGALSAGGNLRTAGTVRFDGVADTALAVASDSFYFLDGDGLMKRDSMVDYATAIAGDGLSATDGVLAVSLTELTEAAVNVGADSLIFIDADGNVTRRDTFADYATALAGDALVAASGVLAVQTSGSALTIASDKLGISGSIAGDCLDKGPGDGVDSIRSLHVVADESTIEAVGRASLRIKDDGVTGAKLAPAVAGVGLKQDGSGNLDLDLNELGAAAIAAGDSFAFIDATDSNASKKETVDDLATLFAGDGLSASSAVLSVAVSGALKVASDKVGISGSFAGTGIGFLGGVDSISGVELDLNELSAGAIADGDSLAFIDANDSNVTKKEAVADLAALFAGAGLGASNSVIAVANATNGGLAINADDMQVDLNDLSAAAVDVSADSIAIIDAGDSNATKKESIADLVSGMAGAGLSAASGQLSVTGNNVALKADGDTLVEGYNYFADASADATVSMPASPSVGDVVTIKAGNLTSGAEVIINRQGSHTIDGLTQLRIESPFGAVTCVYVVANDWRIV